MPIKPDAVGTTAGPVEHSWDSKDCLLYALGVGAGVDELPYTTENSIGVTQHVLPTFAVIAGGGAPALSAIGSFDLAMLVHGEQGIELPGPIPPEGRVLTTTTITGIYDKGSGALVAMESRSLDAESGELRFVNHSALFIRGEGNFGGDRGPSAPPPPPERRPDEVVTYETAPDQALLYRLSGDRNPLHSDPTFAERAGFERPILHGLCTYGFTGRALLHRLCDGDSSRLAAMSGRFSRPVYPGDLLTVSMWVEDDNVRFRTETQRGDVVLDGGRARLR